jgi:sugar O-acyltransferase (sialic acid O-acetyltransferase NeuD family)
VTESKRFSLIGGGGLGLEVAAYLRDVYGANTIELNLWDDHVPTERPAAGEKLSLQHRGAVADIVVGHDECVLICIGNPAVRQGIAGILREKSVVLGQFIHPSAIVSSQAHLSPGCIVLPFSCISFAASLGYNSVVNSHVAVGHHAQIGASCVISPQVLIAGGARIGNGVFVGSGAVVTPGISVGDNSKIAAASVVYRKSAAGAFLSGNPAKNYS